ncbi:MAG: EamA family transporter [Pedobacter sp.]|nr:EamA family transporter [Pedobacter sp.]
MGKLLENRWVLLVIIALTWGSSFILIKKSLIGFSPYQIGAVRVAFSGLMLLKIGFPAIRKMNRNTIFWLSITGFFGNFIPMFLFPLAQEKVSSSMAGILDSLVPVFVLVFGYLFFTIKTKQSQIIGAIIGFAGAALLMFLSGGSSESSHLGYSFLVILATACYALAALLIKEKLSHVPAMQLSAAVFVIWIIPSLLILFFSNIFGTFQNTPLQWQATGYLAILTFMGTAAAMILYYKLIHNTSPVFASSVTYLLPLVAVTWGLLDNEPFNIWYLVGGALILLGVYLLKERKVKHKTLKF